MPTAAAITATAPPPINVSVVRRLSLPALAGTTFAGCGGGAGLTRTSGSAFTVLGWAVARLCACSVGGRGACSVPGGVGGTGCRSGNGDGDGIVGGVG